jgi:UDPglucose 6-dehydrogenase
MISQPFDIKLGVIGMGYVGLPSAAGFAELGFSVIATDSDRERLEILKEGRSPLNEPGLQELLDKHASSGRLRFSDDIATVVREATILFICVGTPQAPDGQADLSQVEAVVKDIAPHMVDYRIIVERSTVPVTTAAWIRRTLALHTNGASEFDVVSNPEFLREGSAVSDFLNPSRIVLGVESKRAWDMLRGIYDVFDRPIVSTDLNSAEIIKYASNAFLATRISFINMISDLCEATGADITQVTEAMGLDPRIGPDYLDAGLGYGGSCLPKDVTALIHVANQRGVDFGLLESVKVVNESRSEDLVNRTRRTLGSLEGKQIGVLGLSFKPGTDDIRDSPSLKAVEELSRTGAVLRLHDPAAIGRARKMTPHVAGRLEYFDDPYDVAEGSQAVLLLTSWPQYRALDFEHLRGLMTTPIIVDSRNFLDGEALHDLGFDYIPVGRPGPGALAGARSQMLSK